MSVTTLPGCHGNAERLVRCNAETYQVKTRFFTHHFIISTMEIIPVPEASLVPLNITDLAPLILEVRLPNQRAVPKDPQTGFSSDDVLRLHLYRLL